MKTRTVVVGLLLAFLLFTPQGRWIGEVAIATGVVALGLEPPVNYEQLCARPSWTKRGAFADFDPTGIKKECEARGLGP